MFIHILDHDGKTVYEADLSAGPEAFRNGIAPASSSAASACSPGIGSPTSAKTTRSPSPSDTPSTCERSRCVAIVDHEFRRGLDSSGTLPAIARHLSRIDLAVLLGLPVAWRGFWDAAFPNSLGRKEETTPSARGNASRPDPVELFGAVSVLLRADAVA